MEDVDARIVPKIGSAASVVSVLGSWQVCHTVCLGIVTLLAGVGITITGMPLAFLTTIAKPVWSVAVLLFLVMLYFTRKHHCISNKIILLNTGLLIMGFPFLPRFVAIFYTIGGTLIVIALLLYAQNFFKKKHGTFLILGVLLVSVIVFFAVLESRSSSVLSGSSSTIARSYQPITTGTTGNGDVEITLTPSYSSGKLSVSAAVNTHSVDISAFDLSRIAVLSAGGKSILPSSAPTLTGHHAQGVLVYSLKDSPRTFSIRITGVPKIPERAYTW